MTSSSACKAVSALVWVVLTGAAIVAAVWVSLDLQSSPDRGVPAVLPAFAYGPNSSLVMADAAYVDGDVAAQERYARRAIALGGRRGEALGLLGKAAEQRGNEQLATRYMALARAFGGSRSYLAQSYFFYRAVDAGDAPAAVAAGDALFRMAKGDADKRAYLLDFERQREGRRALVRVFAGGANWARGYLGNVADLTPEGVIARAQVLRALARSDRATAADAALPLVRRLVADGRVPEARALWQEIAGVEVQGFLVDPSFEADRAPGSDPFAWRFSGNGSLSVTVEQNSFTGSRGLRVSGLDGAARIADQLVDLAPGGYQVSMKLEDDACRLDPSRDGVLVRLRGDRRGPVVTDIRLAPSVKDNAIWNARFTVPQGAPARVFEIWLAIPQRASCDALWIDDVAVRSET